jgi:hypothetical protein
LKINKYKYWTDEVEGAVLKYIKCVDTVEKNEIYNKYLHIAFQKLIDDVIKQCRLERECEKNNDLKNDLLYTLIIHIEKYNPELAISRGYKTSARVYCKILIRCAIADYKVKSYHEKQNIQFNESHEVFLKNIN